MIKKEISPTRLYRSREAAEYMAVSERTLWQLAKDNSIPSVKIRRSIRYDISDLDAFIRRAKGVTS